jgi:hypothetical protein
MGCVTTPAVKRDVTIHPALAIVDAARRPTTNET